METRLRTFGRGCFFVGLIALYGLVAMKVYLAWRDGMWPLWPLGECLPEGLVRIAFSPPAEPVRDVVVWLLSRDVVEWAAAACLGLWLLGLGGGRDGGAVAGRDDLSR